MNKSYIKLYLIIVALFCDHRKIKEKVIRYKNRSICQYTKIMNDKKKKNETDAHEFKKKTKQNKKKEI